MQRHPRSVGAVWLLLLMMHSAHAAFAPSELNGTYVLRFGFELCPSRVQLDEPPFPQIPGTAVLVNENRCTDGSLEATLNPRAEHRPDELARYIAAEPNAGDFIRADITRALVCPNITLNDRGHMNFIKASNNFSLSWLRVYGRNDTSLALANGDGYTFVQNVSHVILNSLCLFTRFNALDVEEEEGRVCFPAGAMARLADGRRRRMDELRTGDHVSVGHGSFSEIIGWTHRDSGYVGRFVRIRTNATVLTLTNGHFVYVNGVLKEAQHAKRGDWLRSWDGRRVTVVGVERVRDVGLFNPQTMDGDIVVNDVLCSTYTRAIAPMMAHALLAPVRMASRCRVDLLSWLTWTRGTKSQAVQ